MKKLLIVLSIILSLSLCLFSCGEDESTTLPEMEESVVEVFDFAEKSATVELYESATLALQGATGKTVTWRSANPERVTVENGVVFGKMAGTVTVYASDGETEVSCAVTVINSGYIPTLELDLPDEFRLNMGDTYTLNPHVAYNGVKYFNAEYVYSAEGSISVSTSGVITACSVGLGTVTVTAKWHGVETDTLTITFEIEVIQG